MKEILEILQKLKSTTSTKEKLNILLHNKNNKLLESIFKYAYDHITYTYGVTSRTVANFATVVATVDSHLPEITSHTEDEDYNLISTILEILNKREATGNSALGICKNICDIFQLKNNSLKDLFLCIIDRDLKVGVNEKSLNKVWRGIVPKPYYCRCDVFSDKSRMDYPAFIQLKCDGTYREAYVNNGTVTFKTRSGELYSNPVLEEAMKDFPNGYYVGEFTIGRADEPLANRAIGNGNINSDNPDYANIHYTLWDYLTEQEYSLNKSKSAESAESAEPYSSRFEELCSIIDKCSDDHIQVVPTYTVENQREALEQVTKFMEKGLEGGVLKSRSMLFKNGTSKQQLKIKLKVDIEVRCVGFNKGTKGSKYENFNKVILFTNDENTIKGQCSGMTDTMVQEVTKNPEKYIGKVLSIEFNDLQKAEGHEYYALSHPRFKEFRDDKNETDTLEKATKLRNMARGLKTV